MYISIKNSKSFSDEATNNITKYLVSKEFKEQFAFDVMHSNQKETRQLIKINQTLYLVRHTEFAHSLQLPNEVYLASHESYGLVDLFKLGTDANKSSLLYWFVSCRAKHILATQNGILSKNSETAGNVINLARFDDLWIAGNATSTVFALDAGSSHLVT